MRKTDDKVKKRNLVIILSVIVLLIVVGIFSFLNAGNIGEKKQLEENKTIMVSFDGNEIGRADMEFIKNAGEKEFSAVMDTSDTGQEEHYYTGVLMNNVLEKMGIDVEDYKMVTVNAIDGYKVAFEPEEVQEEDNIYIAYRENGQILGTKGSGGRGPYQIVVRKDRFSMRWCKYVVEIELIK